MQTRISRFDAALTPYLPDSCPSAASFTHRRAFRLRGFPVEGFLFPFLMLRSDDNTGRVLQILHGDGFHLCQGALLRKLGIEITLGQIIIDIFIIRL